MNKFLCCYTVNFKYCLFSRWAAQEGVGACLMNKPELLTDMIRQIRLRVPDPEFTISIKMRIHHDTRYGAFNFMWPASA